MGFLPTRCPSGRGSTAGMASDMIGPSTEQTGRGALASTENAVVAGPEAQGQLIHYWDQANTKQAAWMSSRPSYSAEEYLKLHLAPAHV